MMPLLLEEYGDDLWAMNFHDFRERLDAERHGIGCTSCHDPDDHMRLVITSVPLDDYLERQDKDWRDASRDEMRTLVCAQCHVEYYFEKGDVGVAAKVHFPWDYGMNPGDIYRFKSNGDPGRDGFKGQFADWVHAVSKTPMQLAMRASNYVIAATMAKPTEELVPPIREHSRKLQQSQQHLDSHPWLQYLPLLPDAELVWDGSQKVN